jgi:hypothetical protein
LFVKNAYKEALDASQATIKENVQQISSLKLTIVELMKRVESIEKENVVGNESVSIHCSYFNVHFYTLMI